MIPSSNDSSNVSSVLGSVRFKGRYQKHPEEGAGGAKLLAFRQNKVTPPKFVFLRLASPISEVFKVNYPTLMFYLNQM